MDPQKSSQKGAKNRPKIKVDVFNSVQKHPQSRCGTTIHPRLIERSIFVKCRFKRNMSETSFRSPCKMTFFWHQKRVILRAIRVHLTRFLQGSIAFWPHFGVVWWRLDRFWGWCWTNFGPFSGLSVG